MPIENITSQSAEGVITLLQLPGVGPKTSGVLVRAFPTLDSLRQAAQSGRLPAVPARAATSLRDPDAWIRATNRSRRILDQAANQNVGIVTAFEEGYPPLLRSVPDSPLVLYIKGELRAGLRNVACIGTREPSRFGTAMARRLVRLMVEHRWGIVSGLARGIDAECHRATLAKDGYTLAVLAGGLDKVYPAENRRLAEEILERGGALVSEQPFGVAARPVNSIQACRIQTGMSVATVVMQTDLAGGSMYTVRFALVQGRLLVAPVPRGKLAAESNNRGLIALTESTGAELADLFQASRDIRQVLLGRFADRSPAFPVRSRADYPELLARISSADQSADRGLGP